MKKEKTILRKVMALLGMEVKLEQMKLADGITVIQADSFEPEMEVMIVTQDEQMIPLPVGEYELEDGRKLIVMVEGVIASIEMPMAQEEVAPMEQPTAEVPVEASKEPTPSAKKVVETTTKEMHFSAEEFEALKKENEELKAKLAETEIKLSEVVTPITFNPEPKVVVNLEELPPLERFRTIKKRMNG
jgi:hypothetical protein